LEEKLALPGSFLVLTRPDIGEEDYELHLHDSDHDIALTLIMRDLATRAFHVEADRPAQWPNWQRIAQQRYPSLRALRADLQSIGMRDLWPDVTPVLLSEARRLAAERPAGLLRRASPASRYQLSGAEIAWVRAHLTEFDIMERSDPGGYQNDLLLTDSERFFQQPSLPARAQPPTFAPDLSPDALFDLLLTHHPGIVIGETRLAGASDAGRTWARRILAEQLPRLSQAGVDMLFTDLLSSEPHQPLLDAWPPLADAPLPEAIRQHLAQRLPAREVEPMVALLQNAHRHGIGITALDCFLISRIAPGPLQVKVRNFYAQRCIRAHRTGNKWIALTEAGQACHFQTNTMLAGIPGVALLTGAIGLLFAGRPLSTLPDTGNWQRDAGGLRFIQADFIAAPRPPMADGAINTKLEREGDFAVVYAPDAATMAYELRYHHAGRIFVLPIRFSEEGDVELSPPSWLPIDVEYEALDAFVHELSAASGRRNVWPDVTPQPDYSLPLPQRRALLGAELAAQQMLAQFELQREAALQHLVFFSNTAIRNLFRQGKAAWQDELVLLGLTPDMPIENIKQYFALRIHQLSARQQGALLAAIADKQNQAATRVADTWVEQVLRQRVTALRRIAHNRYLAISEHQPGLCAGLVSHFAAAWQLDRRAADTSTAFNAYLDNLQAATTQPDQPMAHLLDLALLAWQFGPRERAFGTHTPLHGLSVAALLAQLTAAAAPVAFELSLGRHAMLLAKDGAPGAETYWLADPNIARCKVAGSAAIARLLEWHGQWLKTLFPSPDGERDAPLFGLRRYRDDLPEQRLFSLTETTSLLGTLTLSALCQPETLAARLPANMRQSHVFRQLQRDLSIAEYRYRLTQTGYRQMLTGRLREVLLRNQAPPSAFLVPVQIKNVVFPPRGGTLFGPRVNARVTLQTGAGVTYEIFIDGALYPTDVTFLRQVDLFRRLIAWGVPHHAEYPLEPALHIDREMLTSPLPNDEPAGEE
ncbi:MAG: hypothetical protein JO171_06000, partial [Paludibacterium sp.]|uniref:hypothetical protein n=1 Tax=Paludibacterium sp. TaxID=1917523 RepID=UPI0025E054CF